jgi:hypothetical protein
LERDALQNAKPKRDTVSRVLDALGAELQEREAVYHIERPPLSPSEISAAVKLVAADLEESPEPSVVADEYWFLHYYNRAARAVFGLASDDYSRTVGAHMLHMIIDPANPRYHSVPDAKREQVFRTRAAMFKRHFASEEFDAWYQKVVARIYEFPWAVAIWEHPDVESAVLTIGRDDIEIMNPVVGTFTCRFELHPLVQNPRFSLATWAPLDEASAEKMRDARSRPELNYSLDLGTLQPLPPDNLDPPSLAHTSHPSPGFAP